MALLLLYTVSGSFAQQLTPAQQTLKQNLLEKSRSQKTTGYIMLGGGAVALGVGIALFADNFSIFDGNNTDASGGAILAALGGASMVGSIFAFSASARNKREAEKIGLSFKLEKGFPLANFRNGRGYYPAISVKWQLR